MLCKMYQKTNPRNRCKTEASN